MKFLSFTKINLIVLVILIALVLLLPDLLFAEEAGNTKIGGGAWYESILWTLVNGFFGLLVWMGGTLLNISVSQFVVGFGELFRTQGLGFAVDHLWTLVRDIFNLTFIFGLVYIGFKMILRSDDSGAKKTLVSIILAALLVNFSLFFAKAIVDFSNIAATQIAQGFPSSTPGEYDVSSKFMQTLGLSSIWGTDGKFLENVATGQGNGIGYIFGTMVIFIITAFVFFAGAILLLIRFVVLNLYLIMSPIMFLGWVFPNLSGASKKYWNDFLNRAFFAPAYLLILYFAFYILQEFNTKTAGKESYAMIFSGENPGGNMNILPYFVITCIFLLAAVIVAQKMSVEGANWAVNFVKSRSQQMVLLGTHPPRALARMGVNASGAALEKGFNRLQAKTPNAWYNPVRWNAVDRKARLATTSMKEAELGTGTTNLKEATYKKSTNARANQTIGENTRSSALSKSNKILSDNTSSTQDLNSALDELSKTIKSMSATEKERLGFDKLKNQNIAINLSDGDIDSLEKTGNFSAQQIKDIKTARNDGFTSIATHGNTFGANPKNPNARAINMTESMFKNKSMKDIASLPVKVFQTSSMYQNITPAMLQKKLEESNPSQQEKDDIKKAIALHLNLPQNATKPSSNPNLASNHPWVKWENSSFGSAFFN